MTAGNHDVASQLTAVADLFEAQGASEGRVRLWRAGAAAAGAEDRRLADVASGGEPALAAIPGIGRSLAAVVSEILASGRTPWLDRLHGVIPAVDLLAEIPRLGPVLVRRIHRELGIDTLEELEQAARDGRLLGVAGFGERRVHALAELLATTVGTRNRGEPPTLALILLVGRHYREAAVPILHEENEGWCFTALFLDTPLSQRLGKHHDWVVVFHERDGLEGRSTVITETQGTLAGRRVVRGRQRVGDQGAVVARM